MRFCPPLLVLCSLVLAACQTSHSVAVTTWRVIDAPARYIRNRVDPEPSSTTTTTTTYSDQGPAGHPVAIATPRPSPRRQNITAKPSATPRVTPPRSEATPKPSTAPQAAPPAPPQNFPVAKSVPGKPGFVYSPFDSNGAMIDVTGYQSGTKVKDPDTKKIFIVP